jgi:hypothetical protein
VALRALRALVALMALSALLGLLALRRALMVQQRVKAAPMPKIKETHTSRIGLRIGRRRGRYIPFVLHYHHCN